MNSHSEIRIPQIRTAPWLLSLLLAASCFAAASPSTGLEEPDTLVFGHVILNGRPATNSAVIVQIRKTIPGPPLAAYPMGSIPGAGSYFALPVERNTEPVPDSGAFKSGDQLLVVLLVSGVIAATQPITLASAGESIRIDFGNDIDANGNGVPDRWEDLHPRGDLASDLDGDGLSKYAEFLAGTNPDDGSDVFSLGISFDSTDQVLNVWFEALRAAGIGYDGLERRYTLERSTNPILNDWESVAGFEWLPGINQTVTHSVSDPANAPLFFRAQVTLSPP
jgi:hypothetical protein